jgi:poly-gamma-glutamate synthesis protein (capsule biosynthesis protein)
MSRDVALGADGALSVQFLGDTMLGDAAQPLLDKRGYDWPFARVHDLVTGDFTVASADAPISPLTTPWSRSKVASYATRPDAAAAFAHAGIDATTLATSHTFDVGPVGLDDTIGSLEAAGLATFGAGPTTERAEQPLLLRTPFGTLGILGMNDSPTDRMSGDGPGPIVLSADAIRRGGETARAAGADWVVAVVHWGDSYGPVNGEQRYWAQAFADAGYDLVVGSGSHVVQPVELIGRMPVVYSLGDFVFGAPGAFAVKRVPGRGLAVGVELPAAGPARLSIRCLITDNVLVGFQPRACTPAEAGALVPTLNPQIVLQDGVGTLPCTCFVRREGE